MQKRHNFPPQIRIEKNMLCLEKFNNFMKNVNFKFNCCCVCNEKKLMQDLNNMPHNRHKYEIGKYENIIQIQPQTSYSK
jgi:hypothetical protein